MLRGQGRTHPGYDALPMQGQSHPPTLRLGQWRHASSPYVDIFGMWEKTGVLKKKKTPRRHGRTYKLHAVALLGINAFFSSML